MPLRGFDWGGYGQVLPSEVIHLVGKENTQRLERTNGITRQQTGRWLSLRQANANDDRTTLVSVSNRPR